MCDNPSGMNLANVAALARLELNPLLRDRLQREMDAIVQYVEMLSELNVDGIEPTAHAVERVNILREDLPRPGLSRDAMLANAPDTIDGELVKVPQVLPGEGMA